MGPLGALSGRVAAQAGWPGPCQNPPGTRACLCCLDWVSSAASGPRGHRGCREYCGLCPAAPTLPLALLPVPVPGDTLPGRGQQEGGSAWVQVVTGRGTRGHAPIGQAQDCTRMGTCRDMQTWAHGPWYTQVCPQKCAQRYTWAHLPGLTPCLHGQQAHRDLGKHPTVHMPAPAGR